MQYYEKEVRFSKEHLAFCCAFLTPSDVDYISTLYYDSKLKEALDYIKQHSTITAA